MFCVLFSVVLIAAGGGAAAWLVGMRLAAHARRHPEAARAWFEHVVKPVLTPPEDDRPKGELP
jgi:hypothetical protein